MADKSLSVENTTVKMITGLTDKLSIQTAGELCSVPPAAELLTSVVIRLIARASTAAPADVQELVFLSFGRTVKDVCLCLCSPPPPQKTHPDQTDLGKRGEKKAGNSICKHLFFLFRCSVLIESRWLQMQGPRAGDDTSLIFQSGLCCECCSSCSPKL